jgi:hypothetical protein
MAGKDKQGNPKQEGQQPTGQQGQAPVAGGQAPDTSQLLATLTQVFATFQNQLQSQAPRPLEGAALTAVNEYNEIVAGLLLKSPPEAPKLEAKRVSSTYAIDLTWTTDNTNNADGFKIGRCEGRNCQTLTDIAQLSSDKRTYRDDNLPKGTYRYQVTAFNFRGEKPSTIAEETIT